jgi:PAS domain S-box-containing protein
MGPHRADANLAALIESTEDLIWSVDLNHRLLTFNRAFHDDIQRNFGMQSAVGMRLEDLLPPARAECWPPLFERALSEGPFRMEYSLVDGRILELAFNRIAQDGETTGISVFGKDITERKTAEAALREAEAKYRDIFEGALEGIYRTSLGGKPLAANPAAARMLGYHSTREFLSAITDTAQQVWLDPNGRSPYLQLLEQHGVVRGYECQFKRKDGTAIWVSLNSRKVFGEDGRVLYTEGFIEDITECKRMQDALRKSEEQFAKAFRGNPAAMLLAKVEGEGNRIVDANEAFERVLGYPREEVIGRIAHELGLFTDPGEYDEWMKQFRGGRIRSFEFHFRRRTGDVGTGLISAESIELDGEPWMIAAAIDITERKEAEARLQAQSERFQSIIEGTDAGYFRLGMDGCYEDANPAWVRMHGFTRREDAIGLHFSAVQVPDNKSNLEEIVEALKRGEPARSGELSRLRRDGTIGYQSFSASAVVDGDRVIGVEGFMIDITERKKIQALYELISENAADVIWIWDLEEGRCVYVSPSVEQLRGFSPEEVLAQPLDQAMLGDSYRGAVAEIESRRAAVESGDEGVRIRTNEVVYACKDGTTVATETVTKLVSGVHGRVRYVIGVSRDITALKRAEAEKTKIEDQLRQAQKLESVGRLAAGVAHDFNNLLTVINGFSRLLLRGMEAGDPLREGLEEIHKAGERAAGLTQQLLAFSRKQMLQPRVLDLNRVVDEMRPMLERLMGEDVEVCVKLHAEATTIRADPHQLGQVLMNLAVNSRDAMPNGGRISIETGLVQWGESEIQSRPGAHAGPYVMLAVSDTGVGMNQETRGHIFEPFFTTKGVGKGTGLGLSTIHGIVEQSGGYVEAASEVGRGTTFQIYLPKVMDAQADSARPEAAAAVGGQETVLVVEDQAVVRRYAAAALRTFGYEVIEAENAEEALRVCERESERINLVLTDVVMPGLSGRELADHLKKRRPGIKVMFMSGYTDDAIVHHGALEKDAEFIQKPFSPDQLAIKVREMLAAAGGPADAEALKSRR